MTTKKHPWHYVIVFFIIQCHVKSVALCVLPRSRVPPRSQNALCWRQLLSAGPNNWAKASRAQGRSLLRVWLVIEQSLEVIQDVLLIHASGYCGRSFVLPLKCPTDRSTTTAQQFGEYTAPVSGKLPSEFRFQQDTNHFQVHLESTKVSSLTKSHRLLIGKLQVSISSNTHTEEGTRFFQGNSRYPKAFLTTVEINLRNRGPERKPSNLRLLTPSIARVDGTLLHKHDAEYLIPKETVSQAQEAPFEPSKGSQGTQE